MRTALTDHYPVLTMLEHYCGVSWTPLDVGRSVVLDDVLELEAFPTGGDPPLYMNGGGAGMTAMGITVCRK